MQYFTIQKNLGHSPRKLRVVAAMVRNLKPEVAVETLRFVNRAAASDLAKAIKTALANSGNRNDLIFKSLEVNEGMKMRRNRVGTAGRGRSRPYRKELSHIKVVLTDEVVESKVKNRRTAKTEVVEVSPMVETTESVATKAVKAVKSVVKKGATK